MLINKLDFQVDMVQIKKDFDSVLLKAPWPQSPLGTDLVGNQISLRHRPEHEDWYDGIGSLKDKDGVEFAKEEDFSVWHKDVPEYTKTVLEQLSEKNQVKFGRIRYMRLLGKTGLRVHYDFEYRYHLAVITNRFAMFGYYYEGKEPEVATCYHIPNNGHFYMVDTRLPHFVYNGSWDDRVHLVCSVID